MPFILRFVEVGCPTTAAVLTCIGSVLRSRAASSEEEAAGRRGEDRGFEAPARSLSSWHAAWRFGNCFGAGVVGDTAQEATGDVSAIRRLLLVVVCSRRQAVAMLQVTSFCRWRFGTDHHIGDAGPHLVFTVGP